MSMKSRRAFLRNAAVAAPAVSTIWSQRGACGIDPRIQHIVVLMLENRSFDHMLGFTFQGNPKVKGYPADLTNLPPNLDPTTEKPVWPSPESEYVAISIRTLVMISLTFGFSFSIRRPRRKKRNRTCGALYGRIWRSAGHRRMPEPMLILRCSASK